MAASERNRLSSITCMWCLRRDSRHILWLRTPVSCQWRPCLAAIYWHYRIACKLISRSVRAGIDAAPAVAVVVVFELHLPSSCLCPPTAPRALSRIFQLPQFLLTATRLPPSDAEYECDTSSQHHAKTAAPSIIHATSHYSPLDAEHYAC